MISRKRVAPIEDEDTLEDKQEGEENNSQEPHTVQNGLASGLPLQFDTVEFRHHFTPSNATKRQDRNTLSLQSEKESRIGPHSPNALMKRRNSNLANCEKMLQEINASAGEANTTTRKENSVPYEAILELACEVSKENEGEGGAKEPSENGEEGSGHLNNFNDLNRPDGIKKPEDPNQALLLYFAKLSSSPDVNDALDLEHIQSLLHAGASVNTSDRFGQTLLHEVSRTWGTDVAQFFVNQGADINKADNYGRTPLHVAASADYPEMVRFLIDNGANFHLTTKGEAQTPLHFAAKNEAPQCVKILLAYGAVLEVRDYKQRTPLQIAAESNSAECARILLEEGASAGTRDDSGMTALTLMVTKMPSVTLRALDQFHITDRSHRKQRYYLNFLEQCDADTKRHAIFISPLHAVVEMNCYELIMHPIFQRLIEVKWGFFGMRAWLGIFLNVLLALAYTVLGVTHPSNVDNYYYPLDKNGWRIPLEAAVVFLTFNEIRKEIKEFYQSRRENSRFISWRKKEIKRDLEFCHPRWTQEKTFVKGQVRQIKDRRKTYFQDKWNYLDWVAYLMLIIVIILHIINVVVASDVYNGIFVRIFACTIIVVWVRLLKFARPFPSQGPFVVILDNIVGDTLRWGFVIAMFYIPYAAAFWMLFSDRSGEPGVRGYNNVGHLVYTVVRYPLVDNYNFDDLEKVYPVMSRVLCGSFLILAAIVLMNLYIALLSNTFQRVYDNARATAAMQRARLLQDLESDASDKKVARYREHIRNKCSPEGNDYLVIISDEEEQNRKQEEKISLVHNIVSDRLGGKKFGKVQKSEFDTVLEDIDLLKRSQSDMQKSLDRFHVRLEEIGSLNAIIYEEIAKLVQHGKQQMTAITDVSTEVTNFKTSLEEKVGSLATGIDLGLENLETEAKSRSSALESNFGARFDELQIEFGEVNSKYDQYEQHLTTRIEELEAFIVSVEEDKRKEEEQKKEEEKKEKKEIKSTLRPKSKSSGLGGFQIVEANREMLQAAAKSTDKRTGAEESISDFESIDGDSTIERQRKRTITMSGQRAREEYINRLKESYANSTGDDESEKDKDD